MPAIPCRHALHLIGRGGFDIMTNGEATTRLGWDNDDPDDIIVGTMDRDDAMHASIGEDYDDKGKPTGGWSGMIEYEPSDEDAGSYSIVGHGDTAEAAIADMEGTLARAIMLNTDGKYVTNETRGTARSDSGLAFF